MRQWEIDDIKIFIEFQVLNEKLNNGVNISPVVSWYIVICDIDKYIRKYCLITIDANVLFSYNKFNNIL